MGTRDGLEFTCGKAQSTHVVAAEIIGRERELAEIGNLLDAVDDLPAAFVVEGEPGIGKTMLWRAGLELARERRFRVLTAGPAMAEARLSFAALGDLLEPVLGEVLPTLPAPQRRALEVALLLAEPGGPPPDPRAVDVAFLGVLRALGSGPSLVAVDDAQWLDPPSAAALAFAVRRLRGEPIAVLLTRRSGDVEESSDLLDLGRWARKTRWLEIGSLSVGALQHLLRERLGVILPRPTLRRVHDISGGNPFYALEIVRAMQRRDGDATLGEVPVPQGLDELVRDRLARLPERTLAALMVVSAAADPTMLLVERCIGPDATEALRPALDARVIELGEERIRFSHPLLASSVYGQAEPDERQSLHRRLAALVDSPEERARHLALGAVAADAEVAAALDGAATHAATRGAPAVSAELLELAIGLTPATGKTESTRRRLDAAASHYKAGDVPRAHALVEPLLTELPAGRERTRAALQLAWFTADMALSKQQLERAVAEAEHDPALLLEAHYLMAYATLLLGDVGEARSHARVAVELAEQGPDEGVLAQCLAGAILMDTLAGELVPEEEVERALAMEARNPQMPTFYPPSLTCGRRAMLKGRFDDARGLFEAASRRLLERGEETTVAGVRWHQAELECRAGNWELAASYSAEGRALVEPLDSAKKTVLLYACALVDAHQGRVADARVNAERASELCRREVSEHSLFDFLSQGVLGFLELSLGNHTAAVRVLRPVPDALDDAGFGEPSLCTALPDLIEALSTLGELDEAERFLSRLEVQARTTDSLWALVLAGRCRGLVLAAAGELDAALSALERALEEHERLPEPFERARTLLVLGSVRRRARRRRAARTALDEAVAVFEALGAPLWVQKAQAELARLGGRAPAGAELTATEERVAELVARGLTNREVAGELVVSDRTVEGHLSRIYAKLGLRSRAELAGRFALRR
jgi:DNA-binding CsgD family transcriptional regulator